MIIESFNFGVRNILRKDFLLFSALLSLPLIILYLFQIYFSIKSDLILSFVIDITLFFYYPIPLIIFIFLVSEQLKRKSKKIKLDNLKILNVCKTNYLKVLVIFLSIGGLLSVLLIPSIAIAFLLPASEINLTIWILIFLVNLIFVVYVALRFVLAPFITIIEKKGMTDSLKSSWKISKGHVLRIFLISFIFQLLLILLFIPISVAYYFSGSFVVILLGVYLLYIINFIYYPSAYTYFYLKALKKKK